MTMKTSPQGLAIIKKFEGFRSKPYLCPAGVPTIGYGSTRYEDGRPVKMTDAPITEAQAQELLQATLAKYEDCVNGAVKMPINQNQFDALVSFAFNVGSINQLTASGTRTLEQISSKITAYNKSGGRVKAKVEMA